MTDRRVRIKEQTALAPQIYEMVLEEEETASCAVPGQFVNLYCEDKSRLLPRPISICRCSKRQGTVTLIYAVVGDGTEEFSRKKAGDTLRMMGPLGNGYPVEKIAKADHVLILGGGLGMPPLLYLAQTLDQKEKTDIFLGFRSQVWMGREFEPYGTVHVSSDDGACGFKGNVLDKLKSEQNVLEAGEHRAVCACGPQPMLKAIQAFFADDENTDVYFSLEERMGCGIGACAGCPARLRRPDGSVELAGVCKVGPVFDGKRVIFS